MTVVICFGTVFIYKNIRRVERLPYSWRKTEERLKASDYYYKKIRLCFTALCGDSDLKILQQISTETGNILLLLSKN